MEILTDARHGWRKNARQTDVVCLGNKNKKVVAYDVMTSVDDVCTQRHELLGTKRIYEKLDQQGVVVSICMLMTTMPPSQNCQGTAAN
mgnify:CR=1 FL=1